VSNGEITKPNICQYWSIDNGGNPTEPARCTYWNNDTFKCTNSSAPYYPYCNLLGTQIKCATYSGTGFQKMCVLPDPSRSVGNRATGSHWATIVSGVINIDDINGYNKGLCDGFGTNTTCSGYAPGIMSFGAFQPDDSDSSFHIDEEEGSLTTFSGFMSRLPLNYDVYNFRAQLSKCHWWNDDPAFFTVSDGKINPIVTKCVHPDEITIQYRDFNWDSRLSMARAPCNGCKPECPHYTGICWEYCVDEKMRGGDKVLAEQILELRYNIRKERWDPDVYEDSFSDPQIHAWDGSIELLQTIDNNVSLNEIPYKIPSTRTYIQSFDPFIIEHDPALLTAGVEAEDHRKHYPSLVKELKDAVLAPIIHNKFDTVGSGVDAVKVFETSDINHKYVAIFGEVFYYNTETYGLNLNDPDLNLPSYIIDSFDAFDSTSDMEAGLPGTFEDIYNDIECYLDFLIKTSPDHFVASSFGKLDNIFYIKMPTFWEDNTVVVLNKGSGRWEFDKISFEKIFCGGIIAQTKFSVKGEGGVSYLPSYESDFGAYTNNNGEIEFSFLPITNATSNTRRNAKLLDHVYIDGVRKKLPNLLNPPANNTYEMTYKLFRRTVKENFFLRSDQLIQLGGSGFVFVQIPDDEKLLSAVIKPWDIEGKMMLHYPDDTQIEMEFYEQCSSRLPVNCCIIKPKHIEEFKQICSGAFLFIKKIYSYERHTTSSIDDLEEVRESFILDDDIIQYRNLDLSESNNTFTLKKFGYEPLMPSAVIKGVSGRIIGQVKTKLITWVRQPYCHDVEIFYSWKAGYKHYTLLPEYWCYGPTGRRMATDTVYFNYTPLCGDHDLSFFTELGPMWYPYDECDNYARYNIVTQLTEYDTNVMELFPEDLDGIPHGSFDMRMLGPADNFGKTADSHASIWACHCDWSYENYEKITENIFNGYARYRGGLSDIDKIKALQNYGSLPKFGNVYRDFLRSFRSIDNVYYYYWNGEEYLIKCKWMPMAEMYTSSDMGTSISEYPYLLYCSNDYYEDTNYFIHPMGLFLANGAIENVHIDEQLDLEGDGKYKRYRFEEIFNTHYSFSGLYYPYPRNPQQILIGGNLIDIISWYTYKDYVGGPDKSIQWVWQEHWKPLVRGSAFLDNLDCGNSWYLDCCASSNISIDRCLITPPYKKGSNNCSTAVGEGRHLFLDVYYPNYTYDFKLFEHRLLLDEGEYTLRVIPPSFKIITSSGSGDASIDNVFWVLLDGGPYRSFNYNGVWDPIGSDKIGPRGTSHNDYYTLYTTCTRPPWSNEVTLFGPGYTDSSIITAASDGRVIETYNAAEQPDKEYYQRGLKVDINTNALDSIAKKETFVLPERYEISFSKQPDDGSNNYANVDPGLFYPASTDINVNYNIGEIGADEYIEIIFKIKRSSSSEDFTEPSDIGIINRIECEYSYGNYNDLLYYLPSVEIEIDGASKYSCASMHIPSRFNGVEIKRCSYKLDISSEDIYNAKKTESLKRKEITERKKNGQPFADIDTSNTVKLRLRISPTEEEIGTLPYLEFVNLINIKSIYLYNIDFVESVEKIKVYERKYNVSYGNHGDFPPHGYDSTGSLLYPLQNDKSTVYQNDTIGGVIGMPNSHDEKISMNKVRGRLMKSCYPDKKALESGNVYKWEQEQKKIHDEIALSGDTSFTLLSIIPPGLKSQLDDLGISFPVWSCEFTNTIVRPLIAVQRYNTYNPCGHLMIWDFQNLKHEICGHGNTQSTFEYAYMHACGQEYVSSEIDAVTAYGGTINRVLVNAFYSVKSGTTTHNEVSTRMSALSEDPILSFPGPVDPLN